MSNELSLYEELVAAGIETDNHESDLYFPMNEQSTAILKARGMKCKTFVSQIDNKRWYEEPFGYKPFWDRVTALANQRKAEA
jgi:hypothetical protein